MDELLPYYDQELRFLRTLAAEFAAQHPRVAQRLQLGTDVSQDPHVERLIQAVALLNARVRHKLDDDFPELTDALLDILYPHYLRPIPSMSIVQFELDAAQAELGGGYALPRGTRVETEPALGHRCQYRTCYPVSLWPVRLNAARFEGRPFNAPVTPAASDAKAVLRLELSTYQDAVGFGQMRFEPHPPQPLPGGEAWDELDALPHAADEEAQDADSRYSLRFYLHAAQDLNVWSLYELLFADTLEIALAAPQSGADPILLPKSCLRPVGFGRHDGLIPYSPRSFVGYRLLTEFFAFPQKFLFFDLHGLSPRRLGRVGPRLDVYFYLRRTDEKLQRSVSRETVRLGCSPIVNLFKHRADPFVLSQDQPDYLVVPDARAAEALEIYSVDSVQGTSPAGETRQFHPFFSTRHASDEPQPSAYWHLSRRPHVGLQDGARSGGTDVYLSFLDLNFSTLAPADWTISPVLKCFNRDLPLHLPTGPDRPQLDLPDGRGPVARLSCLVAPTATLRRDLKRRAVWRLVSQLSLNHLSLTGEPGGLDALREILCLYDYREAAETRAMIEGLSALRTRRDVRRTAGPLGGFCRGVCVELEFDESKYIGAGAYLFASVLNHFFGLYCSVDSWTELESQCRQRKGKEPSWKWPPRVGERTLL